ncbi:MAG: CotH kinase family protein [Eubacteriales bacterium]|nr:CotH kinase family protein [Eubacteriales bacterium]
MDTPNTDFTEDTPFRAALWTPAADINSAEERASITLYWWYREADDKYYLFVPSSLSKGKLRWAYTADTLVTLDGSSLVNGSLFRAAPGSHTLEVTFSDGSQESYALEIIVSSAVSTVFIETQSGSLDALHASKEHEENGTITVLDAGGHLNYAGLIESFHCRGNASFDETDKKSYQIKLEQKTSLLGMEQEKYWLLLANSFDSTLLRNKTAFSMADSLHLAYTPDAAYAEVYCNGLYIGNYLLTEKIKVGNSRVAIRDLEEETEAVNPGTDLSSLTPFMTETGRLYSIKGVEVPTEPEDNTGGYLLELEMSDRYGLETSGFITSRGQPVVLTSPQYASPGQVSYIAERYQDLEDALFSPDGCSPYTGAHYTEYLDMDSFARKYLIEEVCKNLDAAFTSQYLYKAPDSVSTLFYAGPVWDYDKAIAASGITQEGIDLHDPEGLYAAVQTKPSDLWYALWQHPDFREAVAVIYFEQMEEIIRRETEQTIPAQAEALADSVVMNSCRWNVFTQESERDAILKAYQSSVDEIILFLQERADYLSDTFADSLPAEESGVSDNTAATRRRP